MIDLAILIVRSKRYFSEAYRFPKLVDPNHPLIDRIGLQGDAMTVEFCTGNEKLLEDAELFREALEANDEFLSERLRVLSRLLKDAGY